jgi:hypothetical protein
VGVHPSTRSQLQNHLGQAEFSLNVAKNFACLAGTPALAQVQRALADLAAARTWVREKLEVEVTAPPKPTPIREKLPLTRKERLSFRYIASP